MARALTIALCLLAVPACAEIDDDSLAAGLATDEVCQAGDEGCALELRQLRAKQMKAELKEGGLAAGGGSGTGGVNPCASGYVPFIAGSAPGCMDPCPDGCSAVGKVHTAYYSKKYRQMDDVKNAICANTAPWKCLLQENRTKCQGIFSAVRFPWSDIVNACELEDKCKQWRKEWDASFSLAAEAAHETFGDNAQGVNMWQETTWGDLVAAIQQNMSESWSYGSSGGSGYNTGYGGGNDNSCDRETGGTCSIFSCDDSRGATRCSGGKCLCGVGWCAKGGICFPQDPSHCSENTGGTCSVSFCKSSRGATKCKSGQCICKTGGCAHAGKCYPVTDTGGSCSVFGCDRSRGPTTCHRGRCLCQMGYVSVEGRCTHMGSL